MARRDRCKPALVVAGTELCRVRRLNGGKIQKGSILCRYGAWQRKYVVEYITYIGVEDGSLYASGPQQVWAIGIRNLGEFYADGRVYKARSSKIKELRHAHPLTQTGKSPGEYAYGGLFGGYGGGYHPVEPVPAPGLEMEIIVQKPPQVKYVPGSYAGPSGVGTVSGRTREPANEAPEVILEKFIIRD